MNIQEITPAEFRAQMEMMAAHFRAHPSAKPTKSEQARIYLLAGGYYLTPAGIASAEEPEERRELEETIRQVIGDLSPGDLAAIYMLACYLSGQWDERDTS